MDNNAVIESTVVPANQLGLGGVFRIPAVRQVTLLVGLAASVAMGFAIVLWSQSPGLTPLLGELESADAAQVTEALRTAEIPYKLNAETGDILVAADRLHDARLQLASQGLPQSAGMDMIHEQSNFGVSQFMESARYQHALEAELARTISHLGAVRDARVHLALPKQSSFIRERTGASASVLLQLFRGRSLAPDQSSSIVHLVASSVPNLDASNVTLIDQHGRLLSSGDEPLVNAQAENQFKHSRRLEDIHKKRIEDLLTPLVGAGRVRAQVVVDMDFTVTEETRETFDPATTAIRAEHLSEDESRVSDIASGGVPGALSNQPPQAVEDPNALALNDAVTTEPVNSSRSSTRNFEVDRTISHTRPQTGTVRRMSVAVLVDDSPFDGEAADGQSTITASDIERFTALVRESVGFDEARGDTVVVVNAAFRSPPEAPAAEAPKLWEKPILRDVLKQVLGAALVLGLAFGLVRPMLRGLLAGNAGGNSEFIPGDSGFVTVGAAVPQPGRAQAAIPLPNYDEKVAAAKNISGHDPARVAQVVRKWVSADE